MHTRKRIFWLVGLALVIGLTGTGYFWLFGDLPRLDSLPAHLNTPSIRIVDRHGRLLYEALPEVGGRHAVVALEGIPLHLRQATIATEDKDFYTNPGVDWRGILRSAWINLRGGETLAGGSTITQQVTRNLLLTTDERSERRLKRKLREVYLAWRLSRNLSKDEILALYLNQMYYGGLTYGVEAASQTYFGKPVAELDLAECALIAGLPQAPALYNPFTDLAAARKRQEVVLTRMQAEGYISPEQHALAAREPLVLASAPYPMEAPHFVLMVRSELDRLLPEAQIQQAGGLIVRTSLDLDWQGHAERAVRRQIATLAESEDGLGHNANSAALVALDPASGEILALVGSPDYFDDANAGAINMALTTRQPGSTLKPLVYAAAMDPNRADAWSPATLFLDVRTSFTTRDGRVYIPKNYDNLEHGPVLLRTALGSSLNIPAVQALDHIGLDELFRLASSLGMRTFGDPTTYDLSLALGGGEVRLLDLTAAYGSFANGGYQVNPVAILEISDVQGEVLYQAQPAQKRRVLDERVAWLISDILNDNNARLLGFGANSVLRIGRPAAVKTGTTTNFHDNWTVGYTPSLVTGVWVGNTSHEPMREVTGLSGAAPIWHQFMRAVLEDRPPEGFSRPPGLVQMEVCALSGGLPTEACAYRRMEWFIPGSEPEQPDPFYRVVSVDRATGRLAGADTPPERLARQTVLDLPAAAHSWAHSQGLVLFGDLLPGGDERNEGQVGGEMEAAALRLVSPAAGAVYRLAAGFTGPAQRVRLEAAVGPGLRRVSLWVDGVLVAEFPEGGPYQAWWMLEAGEHQAWVEAYGEDGGRVTSEAVVFRVE